MHDLRIDGLHDARVHYGSTSALRNAYSGPWMSEHCGAEPGPGNARAIAICHRSAGAHAGHVPLLERRSLHDLCVGRYVV